MAKRKYPEEQWSLNALSWAAQRAGMSYGSFVTTLDRQREEQIIQEYKQMRQRMREKLESKLPSRKRGGMTPAKET